MDTENTVGCERIELAPAKARKRKPQRLKLNVVDVIEKTPALWRERYRRVLLGGKSMRTAVNVKCAECVGFEDVVSRVGECTTERCPLWAFRPFQDRS